jgi:hypothetical protein
MQQRAGEEETRAALLERQLVEALNNARAAQACLDAAQQQAQAEAAAMAAEMSSLQAELDAARAAAQAEVQVLNEQVGLGAGRHGCHH